MEPTSEDLAEAADRLIVALDFPSAHLAFQCVERLEGTCRWVKVGLELYCAAGNSFIDLLRKRGLNVFLDLKLHDIPNTIAGAVRSLAGTGASLLTLHASGGQAMMSAAVEAAQSISGSPKLLAVTMLTSMDAHQMAGVGLFESPAGQVLRLATLATGCGIKGLVCSAEETALLRANLSSDVSLVVPGIRLAHEDRGDQRRVATPFDAIRGGASMLVVGRPISQAGDPAASVQSILAEIARALPVAALR